MSETKITIVIYTTSGDVGGFLQYPYIYNRQGEWIGWVTSERRVYSVHNRYVGWINDDPRVLRKMSSTHFKPQVEIPQPVEDGINPPSTVPLAPMMPELPVGIVDVLEDAPELLPSIDFGDLREDMD